MTKCIQRNVETLRQGSREKTSVRTSSFAYVSRKDLERDNPIKIASATGAILASFLASVAG